MSAIKGGDTSFLSTSIYNESHYIRLFSARQLGGPVLLSMSPDCTVMCDSRVKENLQLTSSSRAR